MMVFDSCLHELTASLRDPLVPAEKVELLRGRVAALPDELAAFYLECRLSPPTPEVDVLALAVRGQPAAIAAAPRSDSHGIDHAQAFVKQWRDELVATASPMIWLELDDCPTGPATPFANLHVCVNPDYGQRATAGRSAARATNERGIERALLEEMTNASLLSVAQLALLKKHIEELPPEVRLIHVSAMAGRTPIETKIYVAMPRSAFADCINRVAGSELSERLDLLDPWLDEELCGTTLYCDLTFRTSGCHSVGIVLHEKIVTVLEGQFIAFVDAAPERFAHIYAAAGAFERAIALFERAAQRARENSAHHEASANIQAALSLLSALRAGESTEIERRLRYALGPSLMATEGWSAAAVAVNLTRSRALGDAPGEFRELWGQWAHGIVTHDAEAVRSALANIVRLPESAEQRFIALSTEGVTAFYRGKFSTARRYLEQSVAMLPLPGKPATSTDTVNLTEARTWGCEFVVAAAMHLSWMEVLSGRVKQADRVHTRAEQLLEELSIRKLLRARSTPRRCRASPLDRRPAWCPGGAAESTEHVPGPRGSAREPCFAFRTQHCPYRRRATSRDTRRALFVSSCPSLSARGP